MPRAVPCASSLPGASQANTSGGPGEIGTPCTTAFWAAVRLAVLALSRLFSRLTRIPVDFFPNDAVRGVVEIRMQRCLQFQVFRPERILHERPRRAHDYR